MNTIKYYKRKVKLGMGIGECLIATGNETARW